MDHEKANEYNQDPPLKQLRCFIDYSKAFISVDHNVLRNTLREMGFPRHLIALLHKMYSGQEADERTEVGDTVPFWTGK